MKIPKLGCVPSRIRPAPVASVLLAGLLMQIAGIALAQGGAKPWEVPGTNASDIIAGPDGGIYVWVPPGTFRMGSTEADIKATEQFGMQAIWLKQETPAHQVQLSHGFWLGRSEVTNRQFRIFCTATNTPCPRKIDQGDDNPVVLVNWQEIQDYCRHFGTRLPTEAEWEWAARGPEERRYPWGQEFEWGKCRRCRCSWANLDSETCPVGQFAAGASWCGAVDMAGNVWEWCADWYDKAYYGRSPDADPRGPEAGEVRVTRGGSWRSTPENCRTTARVGADPTARLNYLGFRCAISPKQQ